MKKHENYTIEEQLVILINTIKEYDKNLEEQTIYTAYNFAKNFYSTIKRPTGMETMAHCLATAQIIADSHLDISTIKAAILHETLKPNGFTYNEIEDKFGSEIAVLVDGVNKLYALNYDSEKASEQAEGWRKMFMAIAKDVRVIIIKLADRLDTMRTIKKEPPSEHRKKKAQETLDIYAPIAHRLGIQSIKWELEDLSMMIINPDEYNNLRKLVTTQRESRQGYINSKIDEIQRRLKENNINAHIEGRAKHFYSIYKKMKKKGHSIDEIYDLLAIRIIVNTVQDCYIVLGVVHELYKPMPGRFKDYICNPKTNMYQSLHTTVFGENGTPFEIQIRTWDMHMVADYGVAAHFLYKEGKSKMSKADQELVWVRQTMELQNSLAEGISTPKDLKVDLFGDEVFIFTPRGDIINLPDGSCGIDFAYAIHQAIGDKMVGFKINDHIVPITTKLKNGDVCSVITSDNSKGPGRDWLKFVKSSQAKSKIQQFFKKANRDENVKKGKEALEKEIKKSRINVSEVMKFMPKVLERYNYNHADDCYAAIGYGGLPVGKVVTKLLEEFKKEEKVELSTEEIISSVIKPAKPSSAGIVVEGIDNCLVKLAKCCNPLPGDDIVGYVSIGRGVSVHKADCPNVKHINGINERQIGVMWQKESSGIYKANIYIEAKDRPDLIVDITRLLAEYKIKMNGIKTKTLKDKTMLIALTVQVSDTGELDKILKNLTRIRDVYEVRREK